jgi:hypothetical protein
MPESIYKKGNFNLVIILGVVLLVLLAGGMALSIGVATVDWVADEVVPEIDNLGVVGDANLTDIAEYSITPANVVVQSMTFLSGVIYVLGILACVGLAFAFRFTGNKWLAGLFVLIMLMIVLASIFVSNMYEDFYDDDSEMGTRLKEQTVLSWFILESPLVMSIVGFVCGIIMFTGEGGEETI